MEVFKQILYYINFFFLAYTILYSLFLFVSVIVGSMTLYHMKKERRLKNYYLEDVHVPISIIVPAYNEEVTIVDSINSLLKLDYKTYEIVIVDDGSKDNTSKVLISTFNMIKIDAPIQKVVNCAKEEYVYKTFAYKVPITLVRKVNGGSKADANNMGINASRYPYFLCMDADSVLQSNSLREIAMPITEDDSVVAVGGSVRILNDVTIKDGKIAHFEFAHNPLAAYQAMEYDRSFLLARLFFDKIHGSIIISGAFGLFRKDVVVAAGGYDSASFGEDMDLLMHLHMYCTDSKVNYSVRYMPSAVCWTQAPETFKDLKSQRIRWHLGLKQNIRKYKKMILHPKYKAVGMFTIPVFILFEVISPIVEVLGFISIIASLVLGVTNGWAMLGLIGLFALFGMLISIISYFSRVHTLDLKVNFKDFIKIILLCLMETFFLHFYLLALRFYATFKSSKKKMVWKSLERKKIN